MQPGRDAAPLDAFSMLLLELQYHPGQMIFRGTMRMNLHHAKRQQLDVHDFAAIILSPCDLWHRVLDHHGICFSVVLSCRLMLFV